MNKRVNFSAQEKEELISLVSKYRDTIENKKTNGVSARDKDAAWEHLHFEFNSKGLNTFRTKEQLKKYWANIKQIERQVAATTKINRLGTGGGPFQPQNEPDETILEIINNKTVAGLENQYDDESQLEENIPVIIDPENQTIDCEELITQCPLVITPKTDNVLNCKELTMICKGSQPGSSTKQKTQKNKMTPPAVPKLEDLKAQFLSCQIQELSERVEMKRQEKQFQVKLYNLQLEEKRVEVDILLQKKRKLELENEALEAELKKKQCK
ncbi:myb/SANT-like DNA-binding domain-containing protein 4 [Diabrotica virgifera virgifera]|uniref:Regulatory protein zeste n=1 Tax=Diabrotica virgifera virgifera TaxID=50390 RepID=A0ABM5KS65_DIAVI|nr:myb/SANT-like DNA-binding domain-containing protein 4 [Diabrotica virgifera virgifera]